MPTSLKLTAQLTLITVLLMIGTSVLIKPPSLQAQRLEDEAAAAFLAEAGILDEVLDDTPPQGRLFLEPSSHHASDYAAGDRLGFAVALSDNTALIGAYQADISGKSNQGAAYIFTHSETGWVQQQKLVADDGAADDLFAYSVALDGDKALIGAYGADVQGSKNQGAAYLFAYSGTAWVQQQKLVAADGDAGDYFGVSLALDGDTALVGAYKADIQSSDSQGAAYVFTRSGTAWVQQQKMTAADGAAGDDFGVSVALDGDTALVGAFLSGIEGSSLQGAAYVFARSGTTWSEQEKLIADDGAANGLFGGSVALDGDTALIGSHFADIGNNSQQGAAYVFTRAGTGWSQQQKLVAGNGAANDLFGYAVALQGDTALVGAYLSDIYGNNKGAAYVFTRNGVAWNEQQHLIARDSSSFFGFSVALYGDSALIGAQMANVNGLTGAGRFYTTERGPVPWVSTGSSVANDGAADDYFGQSVALDGNTALVGAPGGSIDGSGLQGAAYLYVRNVNIWVQQHKLVAGDCIAERLSRCSVALEGATALVGALGSDIGSNSNQGAAYVFTNNGGTWSKQQKLVASDGAADDLFAFSVALDGDTMLVSAYGAVYLFTDTGTAWVQQQKLVAADGAAGALFGFSLALDGDTALVGALAESQGAAYIFTRNGADWSEQQKLVPGDGAYEDYFGYSVALDGDTALVGAYLAAIDGNQGQGAAYVFTYDGIEWREQQKLVAPDGYGYAYALFGRAVALDGDTALVGADLASIGSNYSQGAAYLFIRRGTVWSFQQKLVAGDGAADDCFAETVALQGDSALIGAPNASVGDNEYQGKVYFFERRKLVQTIDFAVPPDGLVGDTVLLSASASSGLPVTYAADTPAVCTVSGGSATLLLAGECRITASQAGDNTTYAPAPDVTVAFQIEKRPFFLFPIVLR